MIIGQMMGGLILGVGEEGPKGVALKLAGEVQGGEWHRASGGRCLQCMGKGNTG